MNWIILAGLVAFFLFGLDGAWLRHSSAGVRSVEDGRVRLDFTTTERGYRLAVKAEGEVRLAPSGGGVEALGEGDYLDATLERGGTERKVRYVGGEAGIERHFFVDGDERAWSADADRFVAELMPMLLRETGMQAEERVKWLLEQRGPEAVLDEIAQIDVDTVQGRYTTSYARAGPIPDAEFARLMSLAGENIGLDPELATTLIGVYDAQHPTGRRLAELIDAAHSIGLDPEARKLLVAVSASLPGSPAAAQA